MTDEEIRNNVARNISLCIDASDRRIVQIVKELDISRTTLDNYRNGKFLPGLYTAYRLIEYFGISLGEFIGAPKEGEPTTRLDIGIPKSVFRKFAQLPYEKKRVVVDMIDVLSKKE